MESREAARFGSLKSECAGMDFNVATLAAHANLRVSLE
jgi:hypothetical protein